MIKEGAMESGTITVTGMEVELNRYERVACRLVLHKRVPVPVWDVDHMVIDVSPRAIDPRWSSYEYRNTVFMNLVVTGKEVANWLESLTGEAEGYSFNLHPF